MTHYEELGVEENATPEQIRKAYHLLTRILHPDLQPNPELRHAAEAQMRRLNEVVETLCDPKRRSHYDRFVRATGEFDPATIPLDLSRHGPPVPTSRSKDLLILLTGVSIGAFSMFCFVLPHKASNQATPTPLDGSIVQVEARSVDNRRQNPRAKAFSPLPGSTRISGSVAQANIATLDQSALELPMTEGEQKATGSPEPKALTPSIPLPPSSQEGKSHWNEASKNEANRSEPKKFEGVWLNVKERKETMLPGEYSAEFVELRLREEDRKLRGSFRSRYHVQDRAFSPEVSFSFSGGIGENEYAWSGPKGSRGKLHLLMERPNVLKLEWVAEVPGPGSSLMEGSALLIRRLDSPDDGLLTRQ